MMAQEFQNDNGDGDSGANNLMNFPVIDTFLCDRNNHDRFRICISRSRD